MQSGALLGIKPCLHGANFLKDSFTYVKGSVQRGRRGVTKTFPSLDHYPDLTIVIRLRQDKARN